jgi:alkylation response protein AidB-like acyl-CoA dehydrogenase
VLGGLSTDVRTIPAAASSAQVADWVRVTMSEFLSNVVNPGAADRDLTGTPLTASDFAPAAELGLLGYLVHNGDRRTFGLILEHLGHACEELEYASLISMYADIPAVIADVAASAGRPDLADRYVAPMIAGKRFGTFAYTERTDAFDFGCRVTAAGGGFEISGVKVLQTGGHLADVFLTYARDDRNDVRLFLVERGDPGVTVEPVPTTGFKAAGLTRLSLDRVPLDERRQLVRVDGLSHAQMFLNQRRLFVACPMVGRMRAILAHCARHLGGVVRHGQAVTGFQLVQAKLGRMRIRVETSRAVLHDALDHLAAGGHNELFDPVISAAKYTVVENAIALAMDATNLTGWLGYSRELP